MKVKKESRAWTEVEIDYLFNNHKKKSLHDIAKNLERSYYATYAKLRSLPGVNMSERYDVDVKHKRWTDEDMQLILKNP